MLNKACKPAQNAQFQIPRTFCPILSFTSFTSSPKSPPGGPAHSAGPPKMGAGFLPLAAQVSILFTLRACPPTLVLAPNLHAPSFCYSLQSGTGPRAKGSKGQRAKGSLRGAWVQGALRAPRANGARFARIGNASRALGWFSPLAFATGFRHWVFVSARRP